MAAPVATVKTSSSAVNEGAQIDWNSMLSQVLDKFIDVIEATLIIVIGLFLIRYLRGRFRKLEFKFEQQRNAVNLMEKITSGFMIVIIITTALKIIGIDMTLLVSVAILGLSYGLQDVIKNYVAGILILFKSPFKIGEVVQIKGYTGKVKKMDFQSTALQTFDRRHVTIYNSDVMTQSIVNFSNNSVRRLDIDVMVGYESNIPFALQIFQKILDSHSSILRSPRSSIVFKKFGDAGITFNLKFWVKQPCNILKVKTDVAMQIARAIDDQSIFMPYSKGIEVENENGLSALSEARKERIRLFYQDPIFAKAVGLGAVAGVSGGDVGGAGAGVSTVGGDVVGAVGGVIPEIVGNVEGASQVAVDGSALGGAVVDGSAIVDGSAVGGVAMDGAAVGGVPADVSAGGVATVGVPTVPITAGGGQIQIQLSPDQTAAEAESRSPDFADFEEPE